MSWGVSNTGGGAGLSSSDALLRVKAPAQSIVSITKGSIHKSDAGHEDAQNPEKYDYYFIIHSSQFDSINPWSITATLNGETATDTIIIDTADEYDVVMSYHVPAAYQEVTYLQSTGTQYINANYVIGANTNFKFTGQITASLTDNIIFEVTSTSTNRCLLESRQSTMIRCIWGNNSYRDASNSISGLNSQFTVDMYPNLVVNGVNYGSVAVTGQSRVVYLFAGNDIGSLNRRSYVRISYLKITDNSGVVRREFYPCYRKSDSVAGLYDRANNVFYTNAGSGTFVVGADA